MVRVTAASKFVVAALLCASPRFVFADGAAAPQEKKCVLLELFFSTDCPKEKKAQEKSVAKPKTTPAPKPVVVPVPLPRRVEKQVLVPEPTPPETPSPPAPPVWREVVVPKSVVPQPVPAPVPARSEPIALPPPRLSEPVPVFTMPQLRQEHGYGRWYLEFGAGGGVGSLDANGKNYRLPWWSRGAEKRSSLGSVSLRAGKQVSSTLRLGIDVMALRAEIRTPCFSTTVGMLNADAVASWSPRGTGFYLRGGGGLSAISLKDTDLYPTAAVRGGVNVMGGIGYMVPVGRSYSVTLGADASQQWYSGGKSGPRSSQLALVTLALGAR